MADASGIRDAAARGRRLGELFPGHDSAPPRPRRYRRHWNWALRVWSPIRFIPPIFPLRTQSGRKLLHNISIRPVGNRPNLGCLLQIVDVTVVAGRERILRERQNARYDAVVGGAPDAILTLDAEGMIQLVNPAAAREFGYALGRTHRPAAWTSCWSSPTSGTRPSKASSTACPSAGRSSSRPAARTERRAISRPRHRAGRARVVPSSPPSCATSTNGAWPSMRCVC